MANNQSSPESVQVLFQRHVNNGSIEDLVRLYELNGVVIQKNGLIKRGRKEIRKHLEGLLALKPKFSNKIFQTIIVDDVAMVFSNWRVTGTSPNGETIEVSGHSFDVLSRQPDGKWLIAIDNPYGNRPEIA